MTVLEALLKQSPSIRLFLGTTHLKEEDREAQLAAVYSASVIDRIYMDPKFADKLSPCGKVRLRPEMTFKDNIGLVLVPADKCEAILAGCSMQNGRLTEESAIAQRAEYVRGYQAVIGGPIPG